MTVLPRRRPIGWNRPERRRAADPGRIPADGTLVFDVRQGMYVTLTFW
jgi:hypothetical protein